MIHIAGMFIVIGEEQRLIQRCCVCGELLIDTKGVQAPMQEDGNPPRALYWDPNSPVKMEKTEFGTRCTAVPHETREEDGSHVLPDGTCIDYLE